METRLDYVDLDDGSRLVNKLGSIEHAKIAGSETLVAIVSTENIDSYGDIVRQRASKDGDGWLLDRFNRAPVLLWSHDIYKPNLSGPSTRAAVVKDEKLGHVLSLHPLQFDSEDGLAAEIEGKIMRRVISESSVGFIAKAWLPIRDDEGKQTGYEFTEQELMEVSFCNRGANPDTRVQLRTMVSRHPDLLARVEDFGLREIADLREELTEQIVAMTARLRTLEEVTGELGDKLTAYSREQAMLALRAQQDAEQKVDRLLAKIRMHR